MSNESYKTVYTTDRTLIVRVRPNRWWQRVLQKIPFIRRLDFVRGVKQFQRLKYTSIDEDKKTFTLSGIEDDDVQYCTATSKENCLGFKDCPRRHKW